LEGVVDQVRPLHVAGGVEALDAGQLFGLAHAVVGQVDGVFLFLDLVIRPFAPFLQLGELHGNLVGLVVAAHVGERGAGDDQRRGSLVDEDVVHLVDDGVIERPLDLLGARRIVRVAPARDLHVVAQVIEAELAVRSVGDVAIVGGAALGLAVPVHVALDVAGGHAESPVNGQHPFTVAAGQGGGYRGGVDVPAFVGGVIRRARGPPRLFCAG